MSKPNTRYRLETEHFSCNTTSNVPPETLYPDYKSQTRLSRFKVLLES